MDVKHAGFLVIDPDDGVTDVRPVSRTKAISLVTGSVLLNPDTHHLPPLSVHRLCLRPPH
jgi:hypothetical protein